jgi:hypothetical protein
VIGMEGYMLIKADTKRSQFWDIAKEAIKIKGVNMAHTVLGSFDTILYLKFSDLNELKMIISKVTSIPSVEQIQTLLALQPKKRLQI